MWELLFQEESQSWPAYIGEGIGNLITTTIELPCLLFGLASDLFGLVLEIVLSAALTVSAYLALEEWWTIECSVVALFILTHVPETYKLTKGNWYNFTSRILAGLGNLLWLGAFIQLVSGLQGGIVFGGKMFYPSMLVVADVCVCTQFVVNFIIREAYGWGPDGKPEGRLGVIAGMIDKVLTLEVGLFIAIAVFGLPSMNMAEDYSPALCLVPFLALMKLGPEYTADLAVSDCTDSNGIPPQLDSAKETQVEEKKEEAAKPAAKAEEKPKEAAKTEAKKDDKKAAPAEPKKDDKKAAPVEAKKDDKPAASKEEGEKKEGETEATPEPAKPALLETIKTRIMDLLTGIWNLVSSVVSRVMNFLFSIYARIFALPWNCIIGTALTLGNQALFVYAFWALAEDRISTGILGALMVAPMLLERFSDKMAGELRVVLQDVCCVAVSGLFYYIYKNNIELPV